MLVAANAEPDDSSNSSGSEDGMEEPEMETTVCRSARLQQQQADVPRPGRFVIVPPTLTDEQRREYVRYEEDDEGNLV